MIHLKDHPGVFDAEQGGCRIVHEVVDDDLLEIRVEYGPRGYRSDPRLLRSVRPMHGKEADYTAPNDVAQAVLDYEARQLHREHEGRLVPV